MITLAVLLFVFGAFSPAAAYSGAAPSGAIEPASETAQRYLRAVQARDFDSAYEYISSADRKFRDKSAYLRGQQPLSGFALELARWFATEMTFRVREDFIDHDRARLRIAYVIPGGDEVAAQLLDWNNDRLNALARKAQREILESLEKVKISGKMIMVEGQETIELVREERSWKVYENWRSRRRVMFRAAGQAPVGVRFARNDILVKKDDPFQVNFTVMNRGHREMWVQVRHSFTPRSLAKSIDMIACGSLVPFRLQAGETREISSVYLFRTSASGNGPATITYELLPAVAR